MREPFYSAVYNDGSMTADGAVGYLTLEVNFLVSYNTLEGTPSPKHTRTRLYYYYYVTVLMMMML